MMTKISRRALFVGAVAAVVAPSSTAYAGGRIERVFWKKSGNYYHVAVLRNGRFEDPIIVHKLMFNSMYGKLGNKS